MKDISYGFKLFQPWANEVVKGKLNYLIRAMSTNKRGKVAVIATKNFDKKWLENAKNDEIRNSKFEIGAIGSVVIKDCHPCYIGNIKNKLIDIAGKEYWDYYPKYLIPTYSVTKKLYIWKLDNADKWDTNINVEGGGMIWAKIKIDE